MNLYDLSPALKDDALTILCLEELGSGITRQVYTCTLNPFDWVVKVEFAASGYFQNVREHAVWDSVKDMDLAKWFAPVINISDLGRFLIQARTTPVSESELPERVPRMFTDHKADNWGKLNGRIVCHDYGTILTSEYGLTKQLRKAHWW